MNKFYLSIFILATLIVSFFSNGAVLAQENNAVEINYFYSPTCPHCADADKFFKKLVKEYPDIKINKYEFSKDINLVQDFYNNYKVPEQTQGYVPLIFISDKYFVGFNDEIKNEIKAYAEQQFPEQKNSGKTISVPILGKIDTQNISMPLLAIILGLFDGVNVCSLGALALILGIVISMGSRKKIFLFGGSFVLITAVVYWGLIFLWHRIFVFMAPYVVSMQVVVGILAAIGAWYFFKEFIILKKRGPACKFNAVSDSLGGKLQNIFDKKVGILATLLAVLVFAVILAIVEFPCSAVLPVLFTGIMAEAGIPFNLSMIYTAIYVLFYMLDEIILLLIATFTMQMWIVSGKFMKWMNLLAALVMVFFAFYYLIWPIVRSLIY